MTLTCFWAVLLLLCGRPGLAQQSQASKTPTPRELFDQLNNLSIDPAQIYVLRDAQISRDRVKIYFNQGFIGFLGKVSGEPTGAFFSGEGEVLLIPPNIIEKESMTQFTQSPVLEENFTFAYLRFTDATAKELLDLARLPDPQDLEQPTGFAEHWNPLVHRLNPDFSVRILEDLLGDRERPYFHAQVQGVNLGVFSVDVDERAPEAVSVGASRISHATLFPDIWCSFPSRRSEARGASWEAEPAQVRSYKIDTRINADNTVEGHAELQLESRSSVDRILIFQLSSRLRVSEVRDELGRKLEIFQGLPPDDPASLEGGNNWFAVALPAPYRQGSRFRLNVTYQGKVITDVGNGVLYVGSRSSWYPNLGTIPRAPYDLTFRYPDRLTLVATGNRVEESSSQGWKHSRWISDGAFPIAGFNLGAYDSRQLRAGKIAIEVYATPEAEAALERCHVAAQPPVVPLLLPRIGRVAITPVEKQVIPLDPSALLDRVAESASNAIKYFETLFGPFPYSRLAVAQIPGSFGQGWPELVYLPTLSFLPMSERVEMGLGGKPGELGEQVLVAHEIAHQWWGNEVGWKTEHDQWLSEGFASYAALLYLTQEKDGGRKAHELLRSYKHDLMAKTPEGRSIESGGPIWLGRRLSNSMNPDGYNNIVYKKSCWVIHMLHVLMTDPKTGSDERFFKMLREFVAAYQGANPSTEDFIRHAGKFMTPAMDLDHNHRLDWFFADWVYGTGIPEYKLHSTTRRLRADRYMTTGAIEQTAVGVDFEMLVPVVAIYGREKRVTLGLVAVTSAGGHFKFSTTGKPTRVVIDDENVLAVVR
ncbi:MAG: M1 family aminopeptidase [Terriglobia bacterium]